MLPLLRQIKRTAFSHLRTLFLTKRVRSILQFLQHVEIRQGLDADQLKTVLILAPHPDDEAIGCGGTIAKLTAKGIPCDVLYMTWGELSYTPSQGTRYNRDTAISHKKAKTQQASRILGLRHTYSLEALDGELHEFGPNLEGLSSWLVAKNYDRIYCPWAHDGHPDHAITFRWLQMALEPTSVRPQIWLYEVWSPLVANQVVAIDDTIQKKTQAISIYRDAHDPTDYASRFVGLASYRSLLATAAAYAEAFLVLSREAFLALRFQTPSFAKESGRAPLLLPRKTEPTLY